jgi:2-amino-4-hydroxy-6-hydroxymethyldihydropteridine diphosphokinase
MSESHVAYLSLGSNIRPEHHLVSAIELLQNHGQITKLSNAWESESVGAEGPNYLNACISLVTALGQDALKQGVLLPLETRLGRQRGSNKFAPRTIDIDIVVFDERSCDDKYWEQAFVVIPFAEIYPEYPNPVTQEKVVETASRLRHKVWMEARPEVLNPLTGNALKA